MNLQKYLRVCIFRYVYLKNNLTKTNIISQMKRSYYQNTITNFLKEETNSIFGQLAKNHQHDLDELQKNAWLKQIQFLKSELVDIEGNIYFEFSIPRMGKRVDNILIIRDFIFIIEFKVGDFHYTQDAQYQTIDYCLDLKTFTKAVTTKQLFQFWLQPMRQILRMM